MIATTLTHVRSNAIAMTAASLAFAVLMGFSALVRIPVPGTPVPITLQTFVLFVGAGFLTRRYAMMMVAWYLVMGLCGAPFFAGGGGWRYLFGATGGYLVGFVIAAFIIGYGGQHTKRWWTSLALYLSAAAAIYIPGIVQLKLLIGTDWMTAVGMGAIPFIAFDAIKSTAASCLDRRIGTSYIRSNFEKGETNVTYNQR